MPAASSAPPGKPPWSEDDYWRDPGLANRFGRKLGRALALPLFQSFWGKLHLLSLEGMNIGAGGDVAHSGERWVLERLARSAAGRPGPYVVFDVGANRGDYAWAVDAAMGSKAEIYCFEPSKHAFEPLARLLGGKPHIHLFPFGLSDAEGAGTLHVDVEGGGYATMHMRHIEHQERTLGLSEDIRLTTLDRFCEGRGIGHIDLLKMDVEGHELSVLRGARGMLDAGAVDAIQFEFGTANIGSRTFFQDFFYLLNDRYRIHRILRKGLVPIDRYHETQEVFNVANYLAVARRPGPPS